MKNKEINIPINNDLGNEIGLLYDGLRFSRSGRSISLDTLKHINKKLYPLVKKGGRRYLGYIDTGMNFDSFKAYQYHDRTIIGCQVIPIKAVKAVLEKYKKEINRKTD